MSATAQLRAAATRTTSAAPEFENLLQRSVRTAFDPEAWHAMQERDTQLITDNILHGPSSGEFVYCFKMKGNKLVVGTSVIGARQLASEYRGIRARIVATIEKRAALFIFRTFEPLSIVTQELPSLADETDYYECVMQVEDTKTGNSIQVRKKESKTERDREGNAYDRPHYDVIAESKAYRNGVLSVLPQAVITEFEKKNLRAGLNALDPDVRKLAMAYLDSAKVNPVAEGKTIDQLREAVTSFAASKALPIDRQALLSLSYAQISGLGDAARDGLDVFKGSALQLGLIAGQEPPKGATPATGAGKQPAGDTPPASKGPADPPAQDGGGGPTVEDAIAAAKRGEDDVARDLAMSIGGEAPDRVQEIIAAREAAAAGDARPTTKRTGRPSISAP